MITFLCLYVFSETYPEDITFVMSKKKSQLSYYPQIGGTGSVHLGPGLLGGSHPAGCQTALGDTAAHHQPEERPQAHPCTGLIWKMEAGDTPQLTATQGLLNYTSTAGRGLYSPVLQ